MIWSWGIVERDRVSNYGLNTTIADARRAIWNEKFTRDNNYGFVKFSILDNNMVMDADVVTIPTAFKHPQCGGLILMVEEKDRVYYQCDTCLETAEQLERLAVGKPVIVRRRKRS